ncbi:ABC transporter ATP-binding protein [Marinobacterium aestuarii]|uniref:ABC transporter ATP-binding protein n=1 Tax=Marinobacterium aestuarii TaxID=1821621 RepID=A0A1A9F2B3_9GAMM|nr:ABC transporter transmembrane domain-containing protein [Marinobacterium aestuarii]ANG64001.1 ABC transporter ATP-binding protein [Marinobacterium aestuarii]
MTADTKSEQSEQPADKRGAFRLLSEYVVRDKPLLIKALLLLLLATAADVAGPILLKIFIDDHLLVENFELRALLTLLLVYLLTQISAAWLRYQQTLRFCDMALGAVLDIRERVFAHVLRLPMAFYDRAMTGQLVSRITNDTEAIKDLYVQFLSVVLTNLILLAGIIVAMGLLNVQLMLIALTLVPAVVAVIYVYQRLSGAAVGQTRQLRSEINASISESIAGMGVIQASNQQQRFSAQFEGLNSQYYQARMRTVRAGAFLLRPAIDLLSVLVLVAVVWGFGLQQVAGVAEIGVLYAFLNYLSRFTEPLAEITQRFNLYQQAMVAGSRVHQLIQEGEQQYSAGDARISAGAISVRQLDFQYQPGKPVLKRLSIEVPAGGFFAVVGHTGSGKSTLLNLLLNFYSPSGGEIRLDDQRLSQLGHEALRSGIGLIPQEPFVLAASLYDNIDMGRGLGQSAVENAARQAHLHSLIVSMPDGYETLLGERGTRLSTGQRQQLIIARALAASPRILLLDEATANVDSETEQVVQQALSELHGKVTLMVVAHRLSTIRQADRILVLSHGEIAEAGTHTELLALPDGLYGSMYRLQQQAQRVAEAEDA